MFAQGHQPGVGAMLLVRQEWPPARDDAKLVTAEAGSRRVKNYGRMRPNRGAELGQVGDVDDAVAVEVQECHIARVRGNRPECIAGECQVQAIDGLIAVHVAEQAEPPLHESRGHGGVNRRPSLLSCRPPPLR
jgi:hypothetical protein